MDLKRMATKMIGMSLGDMETFLYSLGRERHLKYETGEGFRLRDENPLRFFKVGQSFYTRKPGVSDEKYRSACISNATYLYEKFPLIFEFYDELENGIVQTGPALDSNEFDNPEDSKETFASKTPDELLKITIDMAGKSIGEKESYLKALGYKQTIPYESGKSDVLSERESDRFYRVGSMTLSPEKYSDTNAYIKACIVNACYLYERFPLVFEFYDAVTKGVIKDHREGQKR